MIIWAFFMQEYVLQNMKPEIPVKIIDKKNLKSTLRQGQEYRRN